MKKRIIFILAFLVIGLIFIYFITIPKENNWTYKLNNNYKIKKTSETDIYLVKDNKKIVNDYISEFSYNDNYVLLKCVDRDINIKFYIIDINSDNIYGPYLDYQEFEKNRKEIIKEKTNKWIDTINYKD